MYKVYILQSIKDQRTYIGHTSNLGERLKEHNSGKVTATRTSRPFKILYTENVSSLVEAKKIEKYWKSGGGRRRLKKYFKTGFPPSSL